MIYVGNVDQEYATEHVLEAKARVRRIIPNDLTMIWEAVESCVESGRDIITAMGPPKIGDNVREELYEWAIADPNETDQSKKSGELSM